MPTIVFFRQQRQDGGTRTGIDVDGETVLGRFDRSARTDDPALRWYVDVRCEGRTLPRDPESARQWLLRQAGKITAALRTLADDLRAGIDADSWPIQHLVPKSPPGTRILIVCSAVRRAEGTRFADILRDIAEHWTDRLQNLEHLSHA